MCYDTVICYLRKVSILPILHSSFSPCGVRASRSTPTSDPEARGADIVVYSFMVEMDENECRICRGDAAPGRPLFHPCKCSGSIKYTHEDCLIKWLAESGSSQCELCHHPFRFEPLYQPDTPHLLPTREFVVGIVWRIRRTIRTAARIALVFIVWLFLLPVATCWTWYSLFVKSPVHLPVLVLRRGFSGLITDAFRGILLSIGIVFVFLGVSSLREYVRHFPDDDLDHPADGVFDDDDEPIPRDLDLNAGDDLGDEAEGLPNEWEMEMNMLDVDEALLHDDEEPQEMEEWDDLLRDTITIAHSDDDDDHHHDNEDDVFDGPLPDALANARALAQARAEALNIHRHENDALLDDEQRLAGLYEYDDDLGQSESGSDMEIAGSDAASDDTLEYFEHDVPDVDLLVEEDNNAEAERGLFGLFELDPDEVPLEVVVGLRGHLRNLFDHAGTVLVSNALFLGIFTFVPLCIGRVTLRVLSLRSLPFPITVAFYPVNGTEFSTSLGNVTVSENPAFRAFALFEPLDLFGLRDLNFTWSRELGVKANLASLAANSIADFQRSISDARSIGEAEPLVSYADNFLVVLLGYGVMSLLAISYVIINSLLRSRYPRFDSPMTRHVAGCLRYIATIVKILVLILFEFGIFPFGCGWWLDICTLDLVGGTLDSRLNFCRTVPWLCTAGHWLLGIVFMVQISLFVSLLREVLRPELLWFLRNPDDPDFHPFRELVEKPLSRHARRMFLSVLIYVPLVLATVYVPSIICVRFLPHVFPLRLEDLSHSLVDIPFGNLLIVPLISLVHHTRPGTILKRFMQLWIDYVGDTLGILHLVARGIEDVDHDVGEFANHANNDDDGEGEREALLRMPQDDMGAIDRAGVDSDGGFDGDEEEEDVDDVRIRAITMIGLAWATLVFGECFFLSAPTIVGRSLMRMVGLPAHHDLHSFGAGCYVLLMSTQLGSHMRTFLNNVDTPTLLRTALPRIQMAIKGAVLVLLWLGVVPLIAGVLLELTIAVPLRVPHNETPYLYLQQDWALGLLIMKLWNKVVLAGRLNMEWRERVERAREGGFLGLGPNLQRTLQEVVLPVLGWTLFALSVPYSFAYGLLPLLGASAFVTGVVYRFSYLAVASTYLLQLALRSVYAAMRSLHDSIRDDKYLVGKRLYNFDSDRSRASAST